MKHPLHHSHECPDCFGQAGTWQWDWDGEDQQRVWIECEGCANSGQMTNCDRCDEPLPVTTAELCGYLCAGCVDRGGRSDQADEMARARRAS